jgi:hypothetical protein
MSATVNFSTVTNSIAALSIAGIGILDTDQIPDTIGLDTHVLAPVPNGFISDVAVTRDELSGQLLRLGYTLRYRYYHCVIGTNSLFAAYAAVIDAAAAILLAFANDATLAGALDNDGPSIENIGPVADPTGKGYHGFDVVIHITQFLEV